MVKKKSKPKGKSKPAARYKNKRTNGGTKWSGADHRRARTLGASARKRGPRSQALPGMEQVRDAKLDDICESIGEGLDEITHGTELVDDGKSAAMQRLHAKGLSSYRCAGVRVALVPGAEKVSVKREKDREVNIVQSAGETVQGIEPGLMDDVDGDLAGAEDLT